MIYASDKHTAEDLAWVYFERRAKILTAKTKCLGGINCSYLTIWHTGRECLCCGAPDGHGGLACPQMTVGDPV